MCIMPGHISLPDCQGFADRPEEAPPASLSPKLLVDLLRTELGFEGLLISDASLMIGLTSRVSAEERVVQGINSGLDVIVLPDALEDFDRLMRAVEQGRLANDRVRQAARRVLEMKARLNLHRDPSGPQPTSDDRVTYQRAAQAMALCEGRPYVVPDDVQRVAPAVLAHRLVLQHGGGGLVATREAVQRVIASVPVPL